MKKITAYTILILIAGCSQVVNIDYKPTNEGCIYSESIRPRHSLFDYFGVKDEDIVITYSGLTCKDMLEHELKHNIHKKPYDSIEVINEIPALKVDANVDQK